MSDVATTARVSLWWKGPPVRPDAMGEVARLRLSVRGAELRAAVPEHAPFFARVLFPPEAPCSRYALRLYGLGVFSLVGPPEPIFDGDERLACELPVASADELVSALARMGWLRHASA